MTRLRVLALCLLAAGSTLLWLGSGEPTPPAAPTANAAPPAPPPAQAPAAELARQLPTPPLDAFGRALDAIGIANHTGTLEVRARHERDGQPARGVNLCLQPDGDGPPRHGRTDEHGRVRFEHVPVGALTVTSDRDDPPMPTRLAAGATVDLDFVVRPGLRVRGTVTTADGRPLPGARIWLTRDDSPRRDEVAVADGSGRFRLLDLPMVAILVVTAPGHRTAVLPLAKVSSFGDVQVTLAGEAAAAWGVVVDAEGQPVPAATLRIGDDPGQWLATDANGQWRVDGLRAGEHSFTVAATGRTTTGTCSTGSHQRLVLRAKGPAASPWRNSWSTGFRPEELVSPR